MLTRDNLQGYMCTCILQASAISADILRPLQETCHVTHAWFWVIPLPGKKQHNSTRWQACLANASQVQALGKAARGRGRWAHQNSSRRQAKPLLPWRLPFSVRRTWLMTLLLLQVWPPLCSNQRTNCCRLKRLQCQVPLFLL